VGIRNIQALINWATCTKVLPNGEVCGQHEFDDVHLDKGDAGHIFEKGDN